MKNIYRIGESRESRESGESRESKTTPIRVKTLNTGKTSRTLGNSPDPRDYLTRSIYLASAGLTRIRSPSTMNGGTEMVTPFSSVAGLFEFDAVAPLRNGSHSFTANSIEAGNATPIGVPL